MKTFILSIVMCLISVCAFSQDYNRKDKVFTKVKTEKVVTPDVDSGFTYKDAKGIEYPIFVGKTGSCYIKKVSKKTGKEYRSYLGKEISTEICKELGIEYKSKE